VIAAAPLESMRLTTNGVGLDVVVAGPADGPPVLLLHGFPEFWYGWHRQIGPLARAGCRVLVPNQRGYDTSDKPPGVDAYGLDTLAADAIGLADAVGGRPLHVVGHDWGGLVAWWTALRHPQRVASLTVLNAPHPAAFARYLKAHPSQRRRSRYIAFFQLPWVPELALRANGCARLRSALVRTSRRGTFSDADVARYVEAWQRPGALTAMLNWYRGLRRARPGRVDDPRIHVPTRVLWGERDRFLEAGLGDASLELCTQSRGRRGFPDASHWLQHEEPDEVVREILAQVRDADGTPLR
jgi:pimeloyl-ACP methyl ester carboxylesterase